MQEVDMIIRIVPGLTKTDAVRWKRALRWMTNNRTKRNRKGRRQKPPMWMQRELGRLHQIRQDYFVEGPIK